MRCWAKIPTVHGVQVTGGSKLNPRSTECWLLGYAGGHGNYKVQETTSRHVFISRDVVFKEGEAHCTSPSVGESTELFDVTGKSTDPLDDGKIANPNAENQTDQQSTDRTPPDSQHDNGDHGHQESLPDTPLIEHHGNTLDTPAEPIRQVPVPR
jgi:hypothetical protein